MGAVYSRLHSSLASPSMLPSPPSSKKTPTWQTIAQQFQEHRDATIAQVEPPIPDFPSESLPLDSTPIPKTVLTAEEISITEANPADLIAKLASGELSSVKVTNAFLRRAALSQKLTNCITELLPTTALSTATTLDAQHKASSEKPLGPLHGLPISVKEHVSIAGLSLNAGFVSWADKTGDKNAHILDILLAAGAVLHARTTEPQTLMHLDTSSNLHGTTVNPFNRALTAGGSSGGEGALIGMRGSCLGIGTDIGGSIRGPAANNGVYGLRPTSYRLPTEGLAATMLGQEQIVPVIGPLSTSLEGIDVFMKTIVDAKPWLREPSLVPIPWKTEAQFPIHDHDGGKKIRVGVLRDDGVVRPHPPVLRALNAMVDGLRKVPGVEIVDWEPYKHDWSWKIISSLYFCDGAKEEIAAIEASGEPWRPLSEFILRNENVKEEGLDIREMWDWTLRRDEYKAEYAGLWEERGVDVILCPVGPGAAPPLDQARYWGYTAQWNLLDYPSLVAPVSKVDPAVDLADTNYVPRNAQDKFNHELYEPMKYANAPVSVQLVGRRYEDEKVIEAMKYFKEKLGLPWAEYV